MIGIMQAGVGISTRPDTAAAVTDAFLAASSASGPPQFSLLFTTDGYEPEEAWRTMRRLADGSPFAGFQTGGVLSREGVFSRAIGIATVSGSIEVATQLPPWQEGRPWPAGQQAAEALMRSGPAGGLAIVLADGFQSGVYEFTRSLYAGMGPAFQYTGGGSGDSLRFARTWQCTEAALEQHATAIAVVSGCEVSAGTGHGWQPHGEPLIITRSEGKRVYEIDGRPAFRVYEESLGVDIPRSDFRRFSLLHPLGFADMAGEYVIRDPRSVHEDDSLEFVTEVPNRGVASLMRGTVAGLTAAAYEVARRTASGVGRPRLVLAFDCVSRYLLLQQDFPKEVAALAAGAGPGVPLLGALTFGEIGSYDRVPLFHNKTIAVAALGEQKGSAAEDGHGDTR